MSFNLPNIDGSASISIPSDKQYAIGVDGINVKVLSAGTSPNVVYRIGDGTVHPEGWDNVEGNKYLDFYVSTGATGAKGDTGETGKSAFTQAVDNGYAGTEQEWADAIIATFTNIDTLSALSDNIDDIETIIADIVPNLAEILQADDNATTATEQAGIATAKATLATEQAGIATTKATEAGGYSTTAGQYRDKAQLWAEQGEDVEVEAGQYSAKHWALKAENQVSGGIALDSLGDVELSGEVAGDILAKDIDGNWKPKNLTELGIEERDATILKEADIGSLIQAYDADTVVDENYVHTDNNYADADKAIVDSVQSLHNSQQNDIANLVQSVLNLQTSNAQGSFGISGLTMDLSTTEQTIPFNIETQSTDTDVFEITNGTGIVKQAGSYSFISTVEFEDIGANGDVATVTFNLRDTTTNDVYYTQSQTIEISNYDRETIPFNSFMVIPDTVSFPVEIDINVVCSQTGYRLAGFKSIISSGGGDIMTIDAIDVALGNKITESLA